MTETELKDMVIDTCKWLHLLVHHCRPARTADGGWVTPIQGDKGFPDLVIVGGTGVLYRELKSQTGKVTPEQTGWLTRLRDSGQDASLWRPMDWTCGRVMRELRMIR